MNRRSVQDAILKPTTPPLATRVAVAAVGSVLVHAVFVSGAMRGLADVFRWQSNADPPPLTVQARLAEPPTPPPAQLVTQRKPAPARSPRAPRKPNTASAPTPAVAVVDAPPRQEAPPVVAESRPPAADRPAPAETAPAETAPAPPPVAEPVETITPAAARPAPRTAALPPAARIRFEVTLESNNYKVWATQDWATDGVRYRIVFAAEARALFFSLGSMNLESSGVIVETGLRPERYVDERNRKRTTVRFSANEKSAEVEESNGNRKTISLAGQAADLMSLTYDLAFNPDIGIGAPFTLTNRDRVEEVRLVDTRAEVLVTEAGSVNTRYYDFRRPDGASGIQVWLAVEKQWLPARIRIAGRDGGLNMVATAYELSPAPASR
jgi:hypothetical protein